MRILWISNTPWSPSGYGGQCALFTPRLQAAGHDVAIGANWGLQGGAVDWNGIHVYPSDGVWGNRTVRSYIDDHKADLTIALCDAWILEPHQWPEGTQMAVWTPIDHYPIPTRVLGVLAQDNIRPIAMSRFGENLMKEAQLDPVYVPHGVDTRLFRPHPELRAQTRKALNIPEDAFLVGMVAANRGNPAIPRKGFPQAFTAFSRFAREHKDAWMYVHSEAKTDAAGGGISLDTLAEAVGCPAGKIRFPHDSAWDVGMTAEHLVVLYSAFDVLLNPSMGEGFGIPIIEAQACGVPVIASDHSAMSELTQAGWLVTGDPWWDAMQQAFFISPSIDSVHAALEAAYKERKNEDLRAYAVEFAQGYDADVVTEEYWKPAIEKLTANRTVGPLNGGKPNRAARRKLERVK
jgi:glycosyltransferase involved in cell wall biosynthesis